MSKFTGIKTVEIEDNPASWGGSEIDLGTPLPDSPSFTPEPQEVENSKGQILYGGNKEMSEWNIPDFTNFAALETKMEADTEVDFRVTFMDDTTEVIHTAATVQVRKNYSPQVGGRNYISVKLQNYRIS